MKNIAVKTLREKLSEVSVIYENHLKKTDSMSQDAEWYNMQKIILETEINDLYNAIAIINVLDGKSIIFKT